MSSRECKSTRASVTVAVTVAILLVSAVARAATGGAPLTIAHSGYLLDGADAPLSSAGGLSMKFRIYALQASGTPQWEGTCATVQVVRGYYTVLLGSTACPGTMSGAESTLDTNDLPTTGERWLEVEVGGVTMSPRMAIATVPTAAVASRALMADSLGVEACGAGYIPVPATALPGGRVVPGFCVMKYEAKNDGSDNAVSVASALPWASIMWTVAKEKCVAAGKHLITEDEWLAIANNVANVDSNWTDGAVGGNGGKLFSGHNDNVPPSALAAGADSDGDNGTGDTNGIGKQRRTLTLSNGQVVWDLAGNVWEWTDATIASASRYHGGASEWMAYNEADGVTTVATKVPLAKRPPSPWNATQGMGRYFDGGGAVGGGDSSAAFLRGGSWNDATYAGVFTLYLSSGRANSSAYIGFRCAGP